MHGKTDWRGSKVHQNTELWTELMGFQRNSSGISSQDSRHCSSSTKFKIYCYDWVKQQRSHTFVPTSWMCKKQTSVSHSSTQSEIVSLNAGLRMDGLLALDLWDIVIEVLRSTNNNTARQSKLAQGNLCGTGNHSPTEKRKREVEQLSNVDSVPTNTHSSQGESQLNIFEDNEAVIKVIIVGRSPTMRHVSRTHRVAFDWLFDRMNFGTEDPNQKCWHQKPTCWHANQSEFHAWRFESNSSLVQYDEFLEVLLQPFQ